MIFDRRRYRQDNYVYLLADGPDAAWVDPGDPAVARELARVHGVSPRWILHTHGHADHTGGSDALRAETGARVLGHAADAPWFAPDEDLAGRSALSLGRLSLRVHEAAGHTPGSVLLEWQGRLLTGDTLFWLGCGNCRHGGDPARLARTFLEVIARLPEGLEVHPGHDYLARNAPFAAALEPAGPAQARLAIAERARAAGQEPAAPTLGEERQANPFLRLEAPGVAAALGREAPAARTPAERFVALRALRDRS